MANSAPSYAKTLAAPGKVIKLQHVSGRPRAGSGAKSGAQVIAIKKRMGTFGH